jgi:hypothetical protein
MAAGFAFFPKLVSRPRKENHFAAALRQLKRLVVHEAQHQYLTGGFILNDGGHQSACFVERDFHDELLYKKSAVKTKNPLGLLRQRAEKCFV